MAALGHLEEPHVRVYGNQRRKPHLASITLEVCDFESQALSHEKAKGQRTDPSNSQWEVSF